MTPIVFVLIVVFGGFSERSMASSTVDGFHSEETCGAAASVALQHGATKAFCVAK